MTEVFAEQDGDRYLIDASGHAGDSESCNHINGILHTFAGYALNAEQDDRAMMIQLSRESGRMIVHCVGDERVGAVFDAAIIALLSLQETRPQAVSVELRRVN